MGLSVDRVLDILERLARHEPLRAVARDTGVNRKTVSAWATRLADLRSEVGGSVSRGDLMGLIERVHARSRPARDEVAALEPEVADLFEAPSASRPSAAGVHRALRHARGLNVSYPSFARLTRERRRAARVASAAVASHDAATRTPPPAWFEREKAADHRPDRGARARRGHASVAVEHPVLALARELPLLRALTPLESHVLALHADNFRVVNIAARLNVTEKAVRNAQDRIAKKAGCLTFREVVFRCFRRACELSVAGSAEEGDLAARSR